MKKIGSLFALLVTLFAGTSTAQRASVAELPYPETIIYNAKIVTVDNADFTMNVGATAQALAMSQGKIMAIGSNAQIEALATPKTKRIDLKGRTVLPGLISTHEHPQDWAVIDPNAFGKLVTDNEIVSRYLTGTPKEQFSKLQPALVEAVSKAKPGQWIRIYMYRGKMKDQSGELVRDLPKIVTKSILDGIAPNNPVEVKGGTSAVINGKAIQEVLRVNPTLKGFDEKEKVNLRERGVGGPTLYRIVEGTLIFERNLPLMAKVYKAELEYWASIGLTAFGSAQEASEAVRAFRYLDDRGEMPVRHAWAYRGPGGTESSYSMDVLNFLTSMVGHGTDYLWFEGARTTGVGDTCTTINARPEVKKQENCNYPPDSPDAANMYNLVRSGLRIAGMHTHGDKDIDYIFDIIEKASKDAGFTLEEIRTRRHSFDHSGLAPRPDQIERMKKLGMIMSVNSAYHYWYTPEVAANYGEEYTAWVGPRKSLSDHGVMNTFETDSPLSQESTTLFEAASYDLTRRAKDGKVHGAAEKIDRMRLLKAMTIWGAYYLLKEKVLGSLETGKFADLIVIDRDYLTIPEEEIAKIKILATMVGGTFVYTSSEFSSEYGLQKVGY